MKKTALILFLAATRALAETDTTPVNPDAILRELQQIKDTRETALKSQLRKALQTVATAASNGTAAMDLYLQSAFTTQFDGESREQTQFLEWKKKEADKLKHKSFQQALHHYLVYLSLTLQSSTGTKTSDLLPALISYTSQVLAEDDFQVENEDLMRRPMGESLIVRGLGVNLAPAPDWVMAPGRIDEMWLRVILPVLRDKQDPSAVDYWTRKIERESVVATRSKRTFDANRFAKSIKPVLLWNRAKEFYLIGQKNRGITEMLAVIKAYPTHPEAEGWAAHLEEYLGQK